MTSALFVGTWLPYSETFVLDQLEHQRRFSAHVFARRRRARTQAAYPHVTTLSYREAVRWYFQGDSPTFEERLDALRPELVHAHFGVNGALAAPLAERRGVPLVVSFHGHDVGGLLPRNRYAPRYFRYVRTARRMFEVASLAVCASADLADTLVTRCGAPAEKVWVHHLGTDVTQAPSAEPEAGFEIVMVGRLVEKKGMRYGIEAFARLSRRFSEARLTIIGKGPLNRALRRLADSEGVADKVEFRGPLSSAEVRASLSRAHVLLAPSVETSGLDRESGILVIKEAGAAARPTVATHHGGIPEIVKDGESGLLVPERDSAALAEALSVLALEGSFRRSLGRRARQRVVKCFDTRIQNDRLEARLIDLISSQKSHLSVSESSSVRRETRF